MSPVLCHKDGTACHSATQIADALSSCHARISQLEAQLREREKECTKARDEVVVASIAFDNMVGRLERRAESAESTLLEAQNLNVALNSRMQSAESALAAAGKRRAG